MRHKIDDEEDMENWKWPHYQQIYDGDTKFLWTNDRRGHETFVTREQELNNVEIRGKNDPKPKIFAENPNSFALFFKDLYRFDNRNPKAKAFSKYLLNKYLHLSNK